MEETNQQPVVDKPKNKGGRRTKAEINRIRKAAGLPTYGEDRVVVKEVVKEVVKYRKRPGRPKKQPIVATSDKQKQQLFLAELLHGNAEKIIKKVMQKALDDDDKDQMACMKLCVERVLPQSYFDKAKDSGSKGVSITIMGVGGQEPVQITEYTQEPQLIEYSETIDG